MLRHRGPVRFLGTCLAVAAAALVAACSSGLEELDPKDTTDLPPLRPSTNLRFMFDPDTAMTAPMTDFEVVGGVIPTASGSHERPIAFVAFATTTPIDDPDDPVTYQGSVSNVFVSAVDANSIDTRAFTYSIAGTMRHTRCVTCHQMNVDPTAPGALPPTPFLTQPHFLDGGGQPPLGEFTSKACVACHFEDWLAPGASFDLRRESTHDLYVRAQVPPGGQSIHFKTDPRVLWALGNAQTPFGGAADDDQDGIDEPEDHDGVRRHAPGGAARFVHRFDEWLLTRDAATGELDYSSADEAVHDLVLASRSSNGLNAGNGPSRAPTMAYVPNQNYDVNAPTSAPAGSIFVAYESDATNMNGGAALGFSDVFRVRVDVFVGPGGALDLVYATTSQLLVSRAFDATEARGDSAEPDVSADGAHIAFTSSAFNLVAGMPVVCRPEVFVYQAGLDAMALVSHVPGDALAPGNQGAVRPRISPDGLAVSYESDATNFVAGDTNSARDVFYGVAPTWTPTRASLTDSGDEFEGHATHGSVHHTPGNVRVAYAVQANRLPSVNSVQCPDAVVELHAAQDARLNHANPGTAVGANADLWVGWLGTQAPANSENRALVQFDLSSIPPGATIKSVELTLDLIQEAGGGAGGPNPGCPSGPVASTMGVHRVTAAWNEANVSWDSLGGSFNNTSSSSESVQGIATHSWLDLSIGDGLIADVQSWIDSGGTNNFGWLLDSNNDVACTLKVFRPSETSPTFPRLTVGYTPSIAPLPFAAGTGACSVFVHDSSTGRTHDISRIVGPDGAVEPERFEIDGTPLPPDATNPVLGPSGDVVVFESAASNLDSIRDFDENRQADVVLADLRQLDPLGFILPYRISVTADGGFGDGASFAPLIAGFTPFTDAYPLGLALFATNARNLGDTDPGDLNNDGVPELANHMVLFLAEAGTVVADFVAEPERQGMNRDVAFVDASSGAPAQFTWDFGDGSPVSTQHTPTHVYAVPGRYSVTLTVDGQLGHDTRVRTEYVHVLGPVAATFTTDKVIDRAPLQTPFVDVPYTSVLVGAIDDPDPNSILAFDADSGESTEFPDEFVWTLRPLNSNGVPIGSAKIVSKEADPVGIEIGKRGVYELALLATGPGGSGTAAQRIEVYQKVDALFLTSPNGPIVRGPANLAVQFIDVSSGDLREIDPLLWTFGDGAITQLADPQHVYAPGVYFASLTTFGRGLDTSTSTSIPIIADGLITAAFVAAPRPSGSFAGVLNSQAINSGAGVVVDFDTISQNQAGASMFQRWSFATGALTGQEFATNPIGITYAIGLSPENVQSIDIGLVVSTLNPAPINCIGQPLGTCDSRFGTLRIYPMPVPSFAAPAPSFTPVATPLRPPHSVSFSGSVVGDGTGTDPLYRWLRSAPNQPNANIEFASTLAVEYEFEDPGVYKIALEVETNGPGGTRQVVRSAERIVVVTASTLSEWIESSLLPSTGAKCINCHTGAGAPAGLVWTGLGTEGVGTAAEIFNRIVADAQGNPILSTRCNVERRRIQPFAPDESVVHNVLLDGAGPLCSINMRVNLGGDAKAKDAHLAVLRSWILDGAPNN